MIVVLLLTAMVLIVAEICTPFFAMLATLAIIAAGVAVYLAWAIHPLFGLVLGVVTIVGLPIYAIAAVRILPRTILGRKLYLRRAVAPPGEATPEAETLSDLVGRRTTAETLLRPSGMIRIDGRRIVAQSESGLIEKGEEVTIVSAAGSHVVVRQVRRDQPQS